MTLKHLGVEVHVDSITRTLEHYSSVADEYAKTIKPPCVGDKWGSAGIDIQGTDKWLTLIQNAVSAA